MMPPFCANAQQTSGVVRDANGQIVPKKIVNPCLDSVDRQNLHRELMFNQKIGRNVLDQKSEPSELEKVLRKQKEKQKMNSEQKPNQGIRNELHLAVLQRANRKQLEREQNETDNQLNPEYLNARAKLRATH